MIKSNVYENPTINLGAKPYKLGAMQEYYNKSIPVSWIILDKSRNGIKKIFSKLVNLFITETLNMPKILQKQKDGTSGHYCI